MIRHSGNQPPAGLSAARGLATLGAFSVLSYYQLRNDISELGLPDRGTNLFEASLELGGREFNAAWKRGNVQIIDIVLHNTNAIKTIFHKRT
jgi:hypothetical protein